MAQLLSVGMDFSQTTLRHIKAYCLCLNLTKKEWLDMEVVPEA